MIKIDLHTHSDVSPDGGISAEQYIKILDSGKLDVVAITDHNTTRRAQELYNKLGNKIIVGEEILSSEGEVIGLFLDQTIEAGLSLKQTIKAIKDQNGIVYIPHPGDKAQRSSKSISLEALSAVASNIDIIEAYNGRSLYQEPDRIIKWAEQHNIAYAASSDVHSKTGIGRTYTSIEKIPSAKNLTDLVKDGKTNYVKPSPVMIFAPSMNRLKKKFH